MSKQKKANQLVSLFYIKYFLLNRIIKNKEFF
jgi:hypothetical protein